MFNIKAVIAKTSIIILATVSLLFAACSKNHDSGTAKVRIHVNDFSIEQESLPGTKDIENVADYSGVKAITLAFYTSDGTEQYLVTQMRDDATTYTTFGNFECDLPMGSYTMVVIGRGYVAGDVFTLTSPTSAAYTAGRVRETFATTQTVTVANTDDLNLNATLTRIVPKVMVLSTDNRTENANSIRFTFSAGGKSFNPTTGLATTNTGLVNTVKGSGATGETLTATSYLFLASDQQTMDITIDVLDNIGTSISHKVVTDVPLKRNRLTRLTGSLFTAGAPGAFSVETSYIDTLDISF